MAINLSRNTRVYFTTLVDANTGVFADSTAGITASNTYELNVLDGYSFTQGTQNQVITISEGGQNPVRGQRSFNTQVDPVDWSFSTYIRPYKSGSAVVPQERVLWNALFGVSTVDGTGVTPTSITRATTTSPTATIITSTAVSVISNGTTAAAAQGDVLNIGGITAAGQSSWNVSGIINTAPTGAGPVTYTVELAKAPATAAGTTATVGAGKVYSGQWATGPSGGDATTGQFSYVSTMASNRNLFQRFALIFVVDNVVYCVDNCFVDQVSVDFGLEAIATAAWSGKGTKLKELTATGIASALSTTAGAAYNTEKAAAPYITNKLSTMTLQSNIGGSDQAGSVTYNVAITGGNITVANNVSYLVPANLGVVNQAIGYFPGQRSITGNVTAYLKTGADDVNGTGDLLKTILSNISTAAEPKFRAQLEMGGRSNATRVEFEMPGVSLQVPSVDVADVVSTTINFTAQAYDPLLTNQAYSLTRANELLVRFLVAN